jgi:hypothetical protein
MARNGKRTGGDKHGWVCLLLAFLVVVGGLLGSSQPSSAEPPCHVQYDHGNLTVLAEDVPLGNLVEAISKNTGIRFSVNPEQSGMHLSAQVESLPVVQALKQLLRGFNYAVDLSPDGEVLKVAIMGRGAEPVAGRTEPVASQPNTNASATAPGMIPQPPGLDRMEIMPTKETMTILPPSQDPMVVKPSTEVMEIRPADEKAIRLMRPN